MSPLQRTRAILRSGLTSGQRLVLVALMDYADPLDEEGAEADLLEAAGRVADDERAATLATVRAVGVGSWPDSSPHAIVPMRSLDAEPPLGSPSPASPARPWGGGSRDCANP